MDGELLSWRMFERAISSSSGMRMGGTYTSQGRSWPEDLSCEHLTGLSQCQMSEDVMTDHQFGSRPGQEHSRSVRACVHGPRGSSDVKQLEVAGVIVSGRFLESSQLREWKEVA